MTCSVLCFVNDTCRKVLLLTPEDQLGCFVRSNSINPLSLENFLLNCSRGLEAVHEACRSARIKIPSEMTDTPSSDHLAILELELADH